MSGALLIAFAIQAIPPAQGATIEQLPVWRLDAAAIVTIGADDARPGHALHNVADATRLADGRIVVADGGSAELRFFSAAGVLLSRFGGRGRGPEEFQGIGNIARDDADTILVLTYDPAIAWVAPEGRVVKKVPLEIGDFRFGCAMTEGHMKQILPDGSIMVLAEEMLGGNGCRPRPNGVVQGMDLVGRYEPARKRFDTLGVFPGAERDGRFPRTFGRLVATGASLDRLFAAPTGADTIHVFSYDGVLLDAWLSPHPARPVPARLKNLPPRTNRTITLPDGTVERPKSPDVRDTLPAIGRLLADRTGHLWIMAYPVPDRGIDSYSVIWPELYYGDPTGSEWAVLNPAGKAIARVRMPPGLFVLEIGEDYVLGLQRGDLDVETVVMFRLHRP
jgi:hypothetical protein